MNNIYEHSRFTICLHGPCVFLQPKGPRCISAYPNTLQSKLNLFCKTLAYRSFFQKCEAIAFEVKNSLEIWWVTSVFRYIKKKSPKTGGYCVLNVFHILSNTLSTNEITEELANSCLPTVCLYLGYVPISMLYHPIIICRLFSVWFMLIIATALTMFYNYDFNNSLVV